jgi:pimeloyl-ACP methyl ester carboxylesterase
MLKRGYVDLREGQIHYRTEGDGKVLLLLHQTPSSSEEYSAAMPLLAKSCQVIAMDTPGHGMSDPPPKPLKITDYARVVKDFLAALGITKASVLGHHTGATIAIGVAVEYLDLVEKLILSGCPYYEPEVREKKLSSSGPGMELKEDGQLIMILWNAFKNFNPSASPEELQKLLIAGLIAGPNGEAAHHAVFEYLEQENMPKVKCPTLLMSGTEDLFLKYMDATCNLIPQCTPKTIEGGGSAIALTRPKEFSEAVLEFLK